MACICFPLDRRLDCPGTMSAPWRSAAFSWVKYITCIFNKIPHMTILVTTVSAFRSVINSILTYLSNMRSPGVKHEVTGNYCRYDKLCDVYVTSPTPPRYCGCNITGLRLAVFVVPHGKSRRSLLLRTKVFITVVRVLVGVFSKSPPAYEQWKGVKNGF